MNGLCLIAALCRGSAQGIDARMGSQQTPFAPKSVAKAGLAFSGGLLSFHAEHGVPAGVSGAFVRA